MTNTPKPVNVLSWDMSDSGRGREPRAQRNLAAMRVSERITGTTVDTLGYLPCPCCGRMFNVRNGGEVDRLKGDGRKRVYRGGEFVMLRAECNKSRASAQDLGSGSDVNADLIRYGRDIAAASDAVTVPGPSVAYRLWRMIPAHGPVTAGHCPKVYDPESFSLYR